MKKESFIFLGLFFEALKPYATSILDTAIDISDAAVSAAARSEVRSAEESAHLKTSKMKSDKYKL